MLYQERVGQAFPTGHQYRQIEPCALLLARHDRTPYYLPDIEHLQRHAVRKASSFLVKVFSASPSISQQFAFTLHLRT